VSDEAKYAPFRRETAICVDLAYSTVEADIRAELERPGGPAEGALSRLLEKLKEHRAVIEPLAMMPAEAA